MTARYNIQASSMASYMGVGFNEPEVQLSYDLGLTEIVRTQEEINRMTLGTLLEDSVLDYFETILEAKITERNSEKKYAFDSVSCKRDGLTIFQGEETGVECKVSNSASKFTENFGYEIQCQLYMEAWGLNQWLLLGLSQGKPVFKLIKRNDELLADLAEMAEAVEQILIGMADYDTFPWHIVTKYNQSLVPLEVDLASDTELIDEVLNLNVQIKELTARKDEITNYFKDNYAVGKNVQGNYSVTVSESSRAGAIDLDELSLDYPNIDMEKYRKEPTKVKSCRLNCKKEK